MLAENPPTTFHQPLYPYPTLLLKLNLKLNLRHREYKALCCRTEHMFLALLLLQIYQVVRFECLDPKPNFRHRESIINAKLGSHSDKAVRRYIWNVKVRTASIVDIDTSARSCSAVTFDSFLVRSYIQVRILSCTWPKNLGSRLSWTKWSS